MNETINRVCGCCGAPLILTTQQHYIARGTQESGLKTALVHEEELQYDAFDCEICGCQSIIQERKRQFCELEEQVIEETTTDIIMEMEES